MPDLDPNEPLQACQQRKWPMELLFFLGVLLAWVALQIWVLPRFGVQT